MSNDKQKQTELLLLPISDCCTTIATPARSQAVQMMNQVENDDDFRKINRDDEDIFPRRRILKSSPTEIISSSFKHVSVRQPGPMNIRLRMDDTSHVAIVSGFERSAGGTIGEVEADGRVNEGDGLIAVNYTPLYNKSFDDMLLIIRHQPLPSQEVPKILTFCPMNQFLEVYRDNPLQVSMALAMEKKRPQANTSIYTRSITDFYEAVEQKKTLQDGELRRFAAMGLPDGQGGIRSLIWKILLG
jgi:hypothetical protein